MGSLEWVKQTKIDAFTNWLNPASLSERDAAATKLKDFPDVRVPIATVKADLKTAHRLSEFRWVGWLHRSKAGPWQCLLNPQVVEDGTGSLLVVYRQPTSGELVLTAIGQLNGKMADIHAASSSSLAEGRPVYLEVP